MDRFTELEVFTRIADEASLTRAADLLGLSVSGVSRCLTSLENRLGVRLVQRTTRQLSLTLEGERFASKAREILGNLSAAEDSVSAVKAEPLGTLRVGASLAFSLFASPAGDPPVQGGSPGREGRSANLQPLLRSDRERA